jgi:hypothetical protein
MFDDDRGRMRPLWLLPALILTARSAAADPADDSSRRIITHRNRLLVVSNGLMDELRLGLQAERGLVGTDRRGPRWRGTRVMGLVGAGYSALGAGHGSMETVTPATGAAAWLGTRIELGGGGIIDGGLTSDFAVALGLGSVVQRVDGITRVAASLRPGIVMRGGRFQLTFGMVLEQSVYAWSRRPELVSDGRFGALTPGVEVGLGAAF